MPLIQLQGQQIFYQWHGNLSPDRETIVFLHDGLGTQEAWKTLPQELGKATGMNALAYDRLGYGQSEKRRSFPYGFMQAEVATLQELLDTLGLKRVHLIGHSDGASIALLFGGRYPERVISLVSVAAHTFVEPRTQKGIQKLVDAMRQGQTPSWLKELHGKRAEILLRSWSKGWLSQKHEHWNIEEWLGFIKNPTLVVQGSKDQFGTKAQVIAIVNRIENCDQWLVNGSGHNPHHEFPEAFLQRVTRFLQKNAGQDTKSWLN